MDLHELAGKILAVLEKLGGTASSWQIKTAVQAQASTLFMALGFLAAHGKVKMEAQGMNYNVTLLK